MSGNQLQHEYLDMQYKLNQKELEYSSGRWQMYQGTPIVKSYNTSGYRIGNQYYGSVTPRYNNSGVARANMMTLGSGLDRISRRGDINSIRNRLLALEKEMRKRGY